MWDPGSGWGNPWRPLWESRACARDMEICLMRMLLDWANPRPEPRREGLFCRNSPVSTRKTDFWARGEARALFSCPSLGLAHRQWIFPLGIIRGPAALELEALPWSWSLGCGWAWYISRTRQSVSEEQRLKDSHLGHLAGKVCLSPAEETDGEGLPSTGPSYLFLIYP